jgi:hypothetical protein
MLQVSTTPVVGLPQLLGWSQVVENSQTSEYSCVCAFSISGQQAGIVGRNLANRFVSGKFFSAQSWYRCLENMVREADRHRCEISLASIYITQESSTFAAYQGSVFLKRQAKTGRILVAEKSMSVVEGRLLPEDTLLLATLEASQFIPEVKLKFAHGYDLETIITSVVPGLHAQEDSSRSSIAFIQFSHKQELAANPLASDYSGDTLWSETRVNDGDSLSKTEASAPDSPLAAEQQQTSGKSSIGPRVANLLSVGTGAIGTGWRLVAGGVRRLGRVAKERGIRGLGVSSASPARFRKLSLEEGDQSLFNNSSKKKKTIIAGVVILILLSAVGVFAPTRNARIERELLEAQELLLPVTQQVQQVEELKNTDLVLARKLLAASIQQLEVLEKTHSQNKVIWGEISQHLTLAKSLAQEISGQEERDQLPVFYDLRQVRSDYLATLAVGNETMAVFVDRDQREAVVMEIETKAIRLVDLSKAGSITSIALAGDDLVVLADGIWLWSLVNEGVGRQIKPAGDSNRDGSLVEAYEQFVYVLNPEKRNIYRYTGTGKEYSDPIGWLQSARGLEFERVTSMAVDGLLWLTTNQGEVKNFSGGRLQDWSVTGLPQALTSSLRIVTDQNTDYLYILEPASSRLVVISKNGEFVREFVSPSVASTTALLIDESRERALLVSGSLVFSISF